MRLRGWKSEAMTWRLAMNRAFPNVKMMNRISDCLGEVAKSLNFDGGDMMIRGITVLVAGAVYLVAPNGPRSVL